MIDGHESVGFSRRLVAGTVQPEIGGELHELEQGDSFDHASSAPDCTSNFGDELAEVMGILSTPSYQEE